jgi:hypothetical protein
MCWYVPRAAAVRRGCWLIALTGRYRQVCTTRSRRAGTLNAYRVGMTPPPRRPPKQCVRASSTCSGVQNAALSNGVHKARRP